MCRRNGEESCLKAQLAPSHEEDGYCSNFEEMVRDLLANQAESPETHGLHQIRNQEFFKFCGGLPQCICRKIGPKRAGILSGGRSVGTSGFKVGSKDNDNKSIKVQAKEK